MHLGHLGVAVADRVGQRRRVTAATEQHQVGFGGRAPVPVIAGQQDLVALGVDVLHPELTAGDRQRARQARRETAGHVLDDVGGQDVVEQLAPRRIRLRERHHRNLAALHRLHAGDEVVAGGIDHAGLADHLPPQVPVVVGGDRGVVRPRRLGPDLVGDGERVLTGHFGRLQQRGVEFPPRPGRGVRIRHRPERAGQHQRADRRVDRRLIGQQVRVEARADPVDGHDDLRRLRRRRRRSSRWCRCSAVPAAG